MSVAYRMHESLTPDCLCHSVHRREAFPRLDCYHVYRDSFSFTHLKFLLRFNISLDSSNYHLSLTTTNSHAKASVHMLLRLRIAPLPVEITTCLRLWMLRTYNYMPLIMDVTANSECSRVAIAGTFYYIVGLSKHECSL